MSFFQEIANRDYDLGGAGFDPNLDRITRIALLLSDATIAPNVWCSRVWNRCSAWRWASRCWARSRSESRGESLSKGKVWVVPVIEGLDRVIVLYPHYQVRT